MTGCNGRDNGGDHLLGDQRPCGVMHEHDVDVGWQREEGSSHRILPGITTGHDRDICAESLLVEHGGDRVKGVLGGGDNHEIHHSTPGQSPHRVHEHGHTTEGAQGLGGTGAEALTAASCGNQNRRATRSLRQIPCRVRGRHSRLS